MDTPSPPNQPHPKAEAETSQTHTDSSSETIFRPLPEEDATESGPEFESLGSEQLPPKPEPFTGEEIANGVMMAAVVGLRFQSGEQARVFQEAFMAAVPILPTPAVLDALGVGEALASYGIHKGMAGGPEVLSNLPPWLRLLLGAGYLGLAVYMGVRAAKEVEHAKAERERPAPGPVSAGDRPGEEVFHAGSVETAAPA